jgi:hypothetical protein
MMQRLKILCLAVMAMVAVTAVASATAFALPTMLAAGSEPSASHIVKFGGGSKKAVLTKKGGGTITCNESTSTSEMSSAHLGTFDILFKGNCEAAGVACKSEDSTEARNILSRGTFHLVYDTLGATLGQAGIAIAFLLKPVKIKCGALTTIEVQGCDLALVTPINTDIPAGGKATLIVEQAGGANKETRYFNEAGTPLNCSLLSSENGGGFISSGEEAKEPEINNATVGGTQVLTEIMG